MDDEDDFTATPPSGDYLAQMLQLQQDMARTQKQQDEARRALLQQATERLQQRKFGPSTAEQLFQLSAAFAQPTRHRGFGAVMGNIMPVLAAQMGQRREGQDARESALEALKLKYLDLDSDAARGAYGGQLAALKAIAAAQKQPKPRMGLDPLGRGVVNLDEATITPFGGGGAQPTTQAEYAALPPGAEYIAPDGTKRRKGGQTGSTPSGGFRTDIPSGNPLEPWTGP